MIASGSQPRLEGGAGSLRQDTQKTVAESRLSGDLTGLAGWSWCASFRRIVAQRCPATSVGCSRAHQHRATRKTVLFTCLLSRQIMTRTRPFEGEHRRRFGSVTPARSGTARMLLDFQRALPHFGWVWRWLGRHAPRGRWVTSTVLAGT